MFVSSSMFPPLIVDALLSLPLLHLIAIVKEKQTKQFFVIKFFMLMCIATSYDSFDYSHNMQVWLYMSTTMLLLIQTMFRVNISKKEREQISLNRAIFFVDKMLVLVISGHFNFGP